MAIHIIHRLFSYWLVLHNFHQELQCSWRLRGYRLGRKMFCSYGGISRIMKAISTSLRTFFAGAREPYGLSLWCCMYPKLSRPGMKPKAVLGPSWPSSVCTSQPHFHLNIWSRTSHQEKIAAKNGRKQNQRTSQLRRDLWSCSSLAHLKARLPPTSDQNFLSFCVLLWTHAGCRREQERLWDGKETGDKEDQQTNLP